MTPAALTACDCEFTASGCSGACAGATTMPPASAAAMTCEQLGVCQNTAKPCGATCERAEREDKPIITPEGCEAMCVLALVLLAALGGSAVWAIAARVWP